MIWIKISERKPEFPCFTINSPNGQCLLWYSDPGPILGKTTHWLPFTPPAPELSEGMRAYAAWVKAHNWDGEASTNEAWHAALTWASERVEKHAKRLDDIAGRTCGTDQAKAIAEVLEAAKSR